MAAILRILTQSLDRTLHPDVIQRGGMDLLRGRMLSLYSILILIACLILGGSALLASREGQTLLITPMAMGQALLILALNRLTRNHALLAAVNLIMISMLVGAGITLKIGSVFAPSFLWFPLLTLPAFLLCGWRLGILVSALILLVALGSVALSSMLGEALPYHGLRSAGLRNILSSVMVANILALAMVALFFHLWREHEKSSREQMGWVQRTVRMQELLQMSGHFALQTHGPLDVLGTALHNLEEPLKQQRPARELLPLLEGLESSIQDLASVAKSFSLFSRRYLEEGLEETSIHAVLQHVDTIYNVGTALRHARLHWETLPADVPLSTRTARLVMLLVSILRVVAAEGGTQLHLSVQAQVKDIELVLHYQMTGAAQADASFDPELMKDMIQELCQELEIQRVQQSDDRGRVLRLIIPQTPSQTRPA